MSYDHQDLSIYHHQYLSSCLVDARNALRTVIAADAAWERAAAATTPPVASTRASVARVPIVAASRERCVYAVCLRVFWL